MVSDETFRLAVELRGEGIDETTRDLKGVDQQFDKTSKRTGKSAQEMEGFSRKWRGAMTAIVVGLGVAAAGLLTQVPVIGEAMSGFGAIIEAVAFQIDQVLRPVFGPLTDSLFEVAAGIFGMEGAASVFMGVVGTIVTGALVMTGVLLPLKILLGAFFLPFLKVAAIVVAVVAVLVGAALLMKMAWERNLFGIRDIVTEVFGFLGPLITGVMGDIKKNFQIVLGIAKSLWDRFGADITRIVGGAFKIVFSTIAGVLDVVFTLIRVVLALVRGDWKAAFGFITDFTDRTKARIGTILDGLWGIVRGTFGLIAGVAVFLWEAAWKGVSSAVETAVALAKISFQFFVDLPGRLFSIGLSIVTSFLDGLKNAWGSVTSWVGGAVDDVVNEFKTGFGIFSPSRVMMNLSGDIVRGAEIGLEPLARMDLLSPESVSRGDSGGGGHAFGGRQDLVVPVTIDGREVARATSRIHRGSFDETGRSE